MEQNQTDKFLLMSFILNFCLTFCLIYLVSTLFFLGLVGKVKSDPFQSYYEKPCGADMTVFPVNEQ